MIAVSNKKRNFVKCSAILPDRQSVLKPSQHYHDVLKAGIVDGVCSGTGLFDDAPGPVPLVFNPHLDNLDLANALIRSGGSLSDAQKLASDGVGIE